MAEIKSILSRISKIFSEISLNYIIVGGIAVIHYGHVRTTQDIDIIIEKNQKKIESLISKLKDNNFDLMEEQFKMALKEGTNISVFDKRSFLRLDVKAAITQREKDLLTKGIARNVMGNRLIIAPLEYVLIGKILFLGNIESIPRSDLFEYQDVLDFLTLYHANKERVDLKLLKDETKKLGLHSSLKKLLELKFE